MFRKDKEIPRPKVKERKHEEYIQKLIKECTNAKI